MPPARDTENRVIGGAAAILEISPGMIATTLQRLWHSTDSHAAAAYHDAYGRNGVYGAFVVVISSLRDAGLQSVRTDLNIEKKIHFFCFFLAGVGFGALVERIQTTVRVDCEYRMRTITVSCQREDDEVSNAITSLFRETLT